MIVTVKYLKENGWIRGEDGYWRIVILGRVFHLSTSKIKKRSSYYWSRRWKLTSICLSAHIDTTSELNWIVGLTVSTLSNNYTDSDIDPLKYRDFKKINKDNYRKVLNIGEKRIGFALSRNNKWSWTVFVSGSNSSKDTAKFLVVTEEQLDQIYNSIICKTK